MDNRLTKSQQEQLDRLCGSVVEGNLSPEDSRQLAAMLAAFPEAIEYYTECLDTHTALCELYPGLSFESLARGEQTNGNSEKNRVHLPDRGGKWRPRKLLWLTTTIATAFVVGFAGYFTGRSEFRPAGNATSHSPSVMTSFPQADGLAMGERQGVHLSGESTLTGHGIVRQLIDVVWTDERFVQAAGSFLQPGTFAFDSGVAVLDFFSGATLVIEGPAQLDVISDWSVTVHHGKVEATVPPAAQGFVINAADTEIIDLGTRFALEVSLSKAQVAVLDGEILLRGDRFADDRLATGDQISLGPLPIDPEFIQAIPRLTDIDSQTETGSRRRFRRYLEKVDEWITDRRLITFFPAREEIPTRSIPNTARGESASAAQLIGPVEVVPGRFTGESVGLAFRHPGSRARVKIDGVFSAYTFACWTKINSLQHRFNALFLADGYENGEPHWQIRDDGCFMFSVMVDNSIEVTYPRAPGLPPIRDAGLHRVYFTEPIWEDSMSGRWIHLAAVYNPTEQLVTQYLNGQAVSREPIPNEYLVKELKIGAAEIGNWGQPFRQTPAFAVRNLDGVIDDVMLFDAALSPAEIRNLYEESRPQ